MIYNFTINISDKKSQPILKQFYLTADNDTAFYRRCLEQYRTQKDQITIVDRIPDAEIDPNMKPEKRIGYKPPKVGIEPTVPEVSDELAASIGDMVAKARGYGEKDIEAKKAGGWLIVETQTPENDLKVAFGTYKKVKLYYKRTGVKKNKVYIILCKEKKEQSGNRSFSNSSKSSKRKKEKKVSKNTRKKSG